MEAARQRRSEGGKEMKEKEEMKKRLERKTVSGTSQEENRSLTLKRQKTITPKVLIIKNK